MFLDRFSKQATQSASPPVGQRSYSPSSRRPSHLAPGPTRPSYNARSSSLSLLSRANSSTGSLPGTSRGPNGSTLRQQITPPPFVEDPLKVLEKIIGAPLPKEVLDGEDNAPVERPDVLAEELDFHGLSLEDFVRQNDGQPAQDLRAEEPALQLVKNYEKDKDNFEYLHQSILACDDVLKSVETSLASFQKDLGMVSTEIETLQSRSTALNTRLENRKRVEKILAPAVEEVSIAPTTVTTISEGPIDDAWLKALAELQGKLQVNEGRGELPDDIKAGVDIKPLLDNLKSRAVERIRDYLVAQIRAIRSPNINVQIIQQQKLLAYKDLYAFLSQTNSKLADEIGQAYVNTLRWYYLNHFTRYRDALDKLSLIRVEKSDALGGDPSAARAKTSAAPSSHDPFMVGRRPEILKASNLTAISSYVAEEDKSTHHIEVPFRSFNLALIDNLSAEYSFLTEFFNPDTYHQLSRRCAAIFEPTFALGQAQATDLVATSQDCLGILLCVRLNQAFAFALQRRKVPAAEPYVNGINMLLWPRFQQAMDAHAESVRALATSVAARSTNSTASSAVSKLSFVGSSSSATATATAADASRMASTAPNYLTQRFAQLLAGILAASRDAGDDEPVARSLGRLRVEFEAFLAKASKGAGVDQRKRDRFLANNYALVLAIIADAQGRLAAEQRTHFEELSARLTEGGKLGLDRSYKNILSTGFRM